MAVSSVGYINKIFENVSSVNPHEVENLYHDLSSAGVILPSAEGRSKGALSIACSEMAKMKRGKVVLDRADIGFPGRDIDEAAPILRQRYGQVCLLINSGSGKSLTPLIDAQKLAVYIAKSGSSRDFRIDVLTSDAESPIGKLSGKYGTTLVLKGREQTEPSEEVREFRTHGILEDLFILGSGVLLHSMAEVMYQQGPPSKVLSRSTELYREIGTLVDETGTSEFFRFLIDSLEERRSCFFAGLGSSQEVARMTAVRVGHVKRAIGDHVYVAGESNTPAPRAGDLLIVISSTGETELVAGWCENFKKMGGKIAAIVGNPDSTIASLSDTTFSIKGNGGSGVPNSFYIKAAFALSPLPIYLVEKIDQRGLKLPEYILRWQHSVT